jgi:hypothetical protein
MCREGCGQRGFDGHDRSVDVMAQVERSPLPLATAKFEKALACSISGSFG